jgi:hypothetical protein
LLSILASGVLPVLLASGQALGTDLSDQQVDELVRRSYQYVAMYNVNNKFAIKQGGWNSCDADTQLKDHTIKEIARPNNDTLYVVCLLDLRQDAIVLEMPAFDSDYVSLMITAYDHYVNVPMTTRLGDFSKPERMVIYSARTDGYKGAPVKGVDRVFEATGDFVSAVIRVMPHASDPGRFQRITASMKVVKEIPLVQYLGGTAKPAKLLVFPRVGQRDEDIFGNNLLEVMQFVMNHTTFDPADAIDQKVLALFAPLGVAPGRNFDPARVEKIDGARFRETAEAVAAAEFAKSMDPEFQSRNMFKLFQPKGQMSADILLYQSVTGPIGLPISEAAYPMIRTSNGKPMNAMHDYVIRMTAEQLPPAGAFWSVTLYDSRNGFFIPNDRKKYSVGMNAGMKLNEEGGIEIYIAQAKPAGASEENWLPITRKDEGIDAVLRIYEPDLDKMKTWEAPLAEPLN